MRKINKLVVFYGTLGMIACFSVCSGAEYREEQRYIYNKVLADVITDSPRPFNTYEQGDTEYSSYAKKLNLLRDKSAPDWFVKLGKTFDLTGQPTESLTAYELIEKSDLLLDTEACLYLAATDEGIYPFHVLYNGKKWLKKAADRGRLGVDFILNVLQVQEKRLPTPLPALKKWYGKFGEISNPSWEYQYILHLPGYEEFKALIEQGDVALYKTLRFFEPGISVSPLAELIKTALKEKVSKGDKTARRQLAELELTSPSAMNLRWNMGGKGGKIPLESQALYDACLGAARELKSLADEGDLQAMYAWMKYGLRFEKAYDRQMWRDIFTFSDRLVEKGFVDVLRALRGGTSDSVVFSLFPWGLLNQYYSTDSMSKMEKAASACLIKRKDFNYLYNNLIGHFFGGANSLDREELDWLSDDMMAPFLRVYGAYKKALERFPDRLDQEQIMAYLEKQAARGYPEAKLALADIWNQGIFGGRDVSKALLLWKEIWQDVKKYNVELNVYRQEETDERISVTFDLSDTAAECLVELVKFYLSGSALARDEAEVLSLAKTYAELPVMENEIKDKGGRFFLLGQLYERGIGTAPDRAQAIEYYKQGVSSFGEHASYASLKRLRDHGNFKGKEADEFMKTYQWKVGQNSSRVTEKLKEILDNFQKNRK